MKIVTVIGARPQFIKAAPFSRIVRKKHTEILIHTGQHYDFNMSDLFFHELSIPQPEYNLNVGSGGHGFQTGRMLEEIEKIIIKEKPDAMLVYGDTNSTLAGALAASKLHLPVFHVEAGLRSYNKGMPEEQNRILTDHISDLLLCPTQRAVENLAQEGIVSGVFNTGDIMYDAVLGYKEFSHAKYSNGYWISELQKTNEGFPNINEHDYYLATIHRAENTNDLKKLREILVAFELLDKKVILPLHPRTRKAVGNLQLNLNNVVIVEPLGYLLMLYLTANAFMVLTDSGGLQKEAYFMKTPCVTLRDQTEWIETLEKGWNVLSPIQVPSIIEAATRNLDHLKAFSSGLFGDGNAAGIIYQIITKERINKNGGYQKKTRI
ncbi:MULTISPECIES: non-hydrolyzing UDP-N-acetylglucosamine 2-epimerase [Paenibacillus]|uniref:non-hydrolyzing UDP-N-acetylglucosamine 2-epimerase n=1 Tax=Paenibacillus TaxID=44249 RepID=UPI0005CE4BA1|nr:MULTISPECIES: UDP-N-acetylglucosamine 2-epimerase (non-hydrolyzing) [Paenibacillus]KAF6587336.1 UDP-N-acetylglucosamine 2-epimerase (non-hydrolyzing) [Paenibacillus sp. EKM211P]KJD40286.1 UDP-N-acetylglucosamine 2-epimerase [Paenibacillus polymyxa]